MTLDDLLSHTLFSIHRNFYQNRLINDYARKKKAKILESQSFFSEI